MTVSDDPLARQWSSGPRPRVYDFTIQHERFFRLLSRVIWAADVRPFYADLAALRDLPDGTQVLDVPCGGGVAFRGLRPGASVRYVAADVSPIMLERARAVAERRGLTNVELARADVADLPYDDGTFDLCLCYNGFHCFQDPAGAAVELARVLRAGAELRGTVVVSGGGRLSARAVSFFQRTDQFGTVGTEDDVRRWLSGAGFGDLRLERQGAWLAFRALRG